MFVLPCALSVLLDGVAVYVATRAIAPSVVLVAFMGLRMVFLGLFAAMFYCERRMSLRFPLTWELANLVLVVIKGLTFLVGGAPFREAWLLLGLCTASIALELVCVAHLQSSAGTLPRQHVFLDVAVGAMATMNLARKPSDVSISPTSTGGSGRAGGCGSDDAEGSGAFLSDAENGEYVGSQRQNSFDERRRFLSDWNVKIDELRVTWKSKVDELAEKLASARRNRGWGAAEGAGGGGGGGAGAYEDGEGAPLLLLARMFAQEEAAIEELEDMWNRDPKWTEFFLPQYTLFLLYASFAHSPRLQELLLGRCESSVHTAHTIFWFLRAFCLRGARVTPVGVKAIEQMLQEVVGRGERPARAFCEVGWGGDGETSSKYMELFDAPHEEGAGARSVEGCFGESLAFVDELVKISMELAELGRDRRTGELRRRLREVQKQFLPSRAIYMPVGRSRHHVYRIAVEESFSFSTKDRAPYLVTLEVLDSRQQRFSPSSAAARVRDTSNGGHNGGDGSPSDAAGSGGRGGGARLMRMLTPKALGQSLREIAKLGGALGREGQAAKGGGSEDGESPPSITARPSGDFLSRGPAEAPATGGGHDGGGSGYDLSLLHVPTGEGSAGAGGETGGEGGGEADKGVDPDGSLTAATLSNSSGSGSAATLNVNNPPSPTESAGEAAPCLAAATPPDLARAAPAAGSALSAGAGMGTSSDEAGRGAPVVGGEGLVEVEGGDDADSERWKGRAPDNGNGDVGGGDGGVGGSGGAVSASAAAGAAAGGEGLEEEGDMAQRPFPPSFSSTNLMGMWSRPSKRISEVGQVSLFSPTTPYQVQIFGSNASNVSINGETMAAATTAALLASASAAAGAGAGAAAAAAVASTIGPTAGLPLMPPDGGAGKDADSDSDNSTSGGRNRRAGGPPSSLSIVGALTPPRSARLSSSAVADRGTPVAPSPGNISAFSGGEGVEALLLPRENSTPGSAALRGGYGTAEAAGAATPATAGGGGGGGGRTPSISPRRRGKRRSGGYRELRSPGGGRTTGWEPRGSVRGRRGSAAGYEDDDDDDDEEDDDDEDGDGDAGSAPPKVIFKERWRQKEARLRRASKLGQAREWRLLPVIVKAGDDLRQEQLASQFFALAHRILKQSPLRARAGLRPYDIVATSHNAGVIEAIPDTVSIDALKKNDPFYTTLLDFFHRHFGPPGSEGFMRARRFFVESLAANCIVTYLLQVKDRHNGNILLDARGRVIHIDFGFMLANSPGGNFNFESAPFKLTTEFVDLMDGPNSACFKGFRELCVQTFMELRRKMPRLILLLETSSVGNAHLPCFGGRPEAVVGELRARFKPEAHDRAAMAHVHALIDRSMGCKRTFCYDLYQSYAVGIAM